MRKFEYKIIHEGFISNKDMIDQLNKLGRYGWEIAHVNTTGFVYDILLKKELKGGRKKNG